MSGLAWLVAGFIVIATSACVLLPWRARGVAIVLLPAAAGVAFYVLIESDADVAILVSAALYDVAGIGWLWRTIWKFKPGLSLDDKSRRFVGMVMVAIPVGTSLYMFGNKLLQSEWFFYSRARQLCGVGQRETSLRWRLRIMNRYMKLCEERNVEWYNTTDECEEFVRDTQRMLVGGCLENPVAGQPCMCGSMRWFQDAPCDRSVCKAPRGGGKVWVRERVLQCADSAKPRANAIVDEVDAPPFTDCRVNPSGAVMVAPFESPLPQRMHADFDGDGFRDRAVRVSCGSEQDEKLGLFVFFAGRNRPPVRLFPGKRGSPVTREMVDGNADWVTVTRDSAIGKGLPPEAKGDAILFKATGEYLYWNGKGFAVAHIIEAAAE